MIIDLATLEELPPMEGYERDQTNPGLPIFFSWKQLRETMIAGKGAVTRVEVSRRGILFRVDVKSHDERGKHALMDKQV